MKLKNGILTASCADIESHSLRVDYKAFVANYIALKSGLPLPKFSAKIGDAYYEQCYFRTSVFLGDLVVTDSSKNTLLYLLDDVVSTILSLQEVPE